MIGLCGWKAWHDRHFHVSGLERIGSRQSCVFLSKCLIKRQRFRSRCSCAGHRSETRPSRGRHHSVYCVDFHLCPVFVLLLSSVCLSMTACAVRQLPLIEMFARMFYSGFKSETCNAPAVGVINVADLDIHLQRRMRYTFRIIDHSGVARKWGGTTWVFPLFPCPVFLLGFQTALFCLREF